jgi:hypothetical protein
MAELALTILIFGAVIMITAVIFGGWMIIGIARLFFRIIGLILGVDHRPVQQRPAQLSLPGTNIATCSNPRCRAGNPFDARFCRRCGTAMPTPQRVQVRRAAMW